MPPKNARIAKKQSAKKQSAKKAVSHAATGLLPQSHGFPAPSLLPQSHGFPVPSLLPQSLPPTPQTRTAVLHTVQHRRRLSPLADRRAKVRIKALSPEPFAPAFAFLSSLVREVLAALLAQLVLCGVINYLLRNPV